MGLGVCKSDSVFFFVFSKMWSLYCRFLEKGDNGDGNEVMRCLGLGSQPRGRSVIVEKSGG